MSETFYIKGMDKLLSDLGMDEAGIRRSKNKISREVAAEVLSKADANTSGPNTRYAENVKNHGSQPYPVGRRTGNLNRSLDLSKVEDGIYSVHTDPNIANYAGYVHDGTKNKDQSERMRAREFLDDAVLDVATSGKAGDIACEVIEEELSR